MEIPLSHLRRYVNRNIVGYAGRRLDLAL